jgi:hypothetical protein
MEEDGGPKIRITKIGGYVTIDLQWLRSGWRVLP